MSDVIIIAGSVVIAFVILLIIDFTMQGRL